ncbi:MAG: DNA/RNA non-specific endonuclease, partial [Zetaproteobacteria bacterium]|nr:DNA/RNA non-specific endonuclease [Zetaproteobacteria bacterium]
MAKYPHYSIITHKVHRAPICAAVNIDQKQLKITQRSDHWKIDPRIGAAHQLNNDYYHNNPWDKGHLARRASCDWGDSQEAAQNAADE